MLKEYRSESLNNTAKKTNPSKAFKEVFAGICFFLNFFLLGVRMKRLRIGIIAQNFTSAATIPLPGKQQQNKDGSGEKSSLSRKAGPITWADRRHHLGLTSAR